MRLFKLSVYLTCNPEELEKEEFDPESKRWIKIYCEKFHNCDECLNRAFKLIQQIVGPAFEIKKIKCEEIIDL